MNAQQEIIDLMIRHRIYLQRLASSHAAMIGKGLTGSATAVTGLLYESLERILSSRAMTKAQSDAVLALQKKLRDLLHSAYEKTEEKYTGELVEFMKHESDFMFKTLAVSLPEAKAAIIKGVKEGSLERIVAFGSFSGETVSGWFKTLETNQVNQIMGRVRLGMVNGETTASLIRAIRGTRESNYSDGILVGYSTRSAETLARTITNGVANASHQEFYKANEKLIEEEVFTATLDGRTSAICASLDGQRFKVGTGPIPPLHPNCRSVRIPLLKGQDDLSGTRPYVRDDRTRSERESDLRQEAKARLGESKWSALSEKARRVEIANERAAWQAANIGRARVTTTYESWFKAQPAWFQDSVLGPSRGKLFRAGGMPLKGFVDKSGRMYNLAELKARDAGMFRKAGL